MNSVTIGGNCTNTTISQGNNNTVYKSPNEYPDRSGDYQDGAWKLAVHLCKDNNRDFEYAQMVADQINNLVWEHKEKVHDSYK